MIASSEDSTIEARLRDASSTCFGAVQGIAGFGDTVSDALRDLAYLFAEHQYELRGNSVRIEVAGTFIQVTAIAGQSPSDVLMALAGVIEGRGYQESAFPEPQLEMARQRRADRAIQASKEVVWRYTIRFEGCWIARIVGIVQYRFSLNMMLIAAAPASCA